MSNPFNDMMNEDMDRFHEFHSEGIRENVERRLSKLALFTNPFKVLPQEFTALSDSKSEDIKLGVSRNLSSSTALGEIVGSYLNVCVQSFFTFNATVLDGITEQLKLSGGRTIATASVKVYEFLAAKRLALGEKVSALDVDGIFDAYKPLQFEFALPFSESYVKERIPQHLATLFQRIGVTEFRIARIEKSNSGVKLTLALPEENGIHLVNSFSAADFADLRIVSMEVVENAIEEVFPIPFEQDIKQVIADIEALLDLGKLEEALNNCISFLSNYRLLRPQGQVYKLQGNYAYINNNRSSLPHATIAIEENRITQALRNLLNSL